jgi:hypothetical protein
MLSFAFQSFQLVSAIRGECEYAFISAEEGDEIPSSHVAPKVSDHAEPYHIAPSRTVLCITTKIGRRWQRWVKWLQVGFLVLTKGRKPKQVERGPSAQGNPP